MCVCVRALTRSPPLRVTHLSPLAATMPPKKSVKVREEKEEIKLGPDVRSTPPPPPPRALRLRAPLRASMDMFSMLRVQVMRGADGGRVQLPSVRARR